MSPHASFEPLVDSLNENLARQLGSFLEYVPVADWDRVAGIYDHSRPLTSDGNGLDKVAAELGMLWKGLKHTLTENQLEKCFEELIIIVIEGDVQSLLRTAYADIKANIEKADKSRKQLVLAAVTSCLDESYYLDRWVDGKTLSAEIIGYWERFYGVDIFKAVQNGYGSASAGTGVDPVKAAREVMNQNLVNAVSVSDYDQLLASILTKLMGGSLEDNRAMMRRYRRTR